MFRGLFKFGVFNAVQSQCYDAVMRTDENMVPPTGSGKTVLFELAIIKMLTQAARTGEKSKSVYIAPTKSLCTEKASSWESKFAPFGSKCSELTGDTVHSGRGAWGDAKDATIMCGEKWDSLTRNWQDHSHILSQIRLFLIDEVHLLNESRGSTLEVVVSRMKLRGHAVRFLVVSATVPNITDVADWIGNRANNGPALTKQFGEEFRPCRLSRYVYGVPRRRDTNDFVFAKALDYKLYSILQQHCDNKPVLVFCTTRKGVMAAAEHVLKEYEEAIAKKEMLPWFKPPRLEHVFNNKQLDKLAACGIGVHHAGLNREDRTATEQLYLKKVLKVLFATSTLAVGVNLPAHTVVIKGVKLFQNGSSQEYSDLDIMQMIGRAGRPQFDKEGVAVIMCEQELEAKYRALAQGQTILESSLHLQLAEHINSEIALGTIKNMQSAKEWLRNSFLYRRLQRNPSHYDIRKEGTKSWEGRMDDLVADSIKTLKDANLVKHDEEYGELVSTEYGDIMSKFYIRQATMTVILQLPDSATIREIVYNKLRSHHDIRYTLKKIEKPSDKVFILIQAILGAINLADPEYKTGETQPYTESIPILRHISRIARAVVEVAVMRQAGLFVKNALEILRFLNAKAWEDRSVLAEHKVTTFAALRRMDPGLIEQLLNRKPPFGHDLLASVNQLPRYTVAISEIATMVRSDGVEVDLSVECGLIQDTKVPKSKRTKKQKRWDMTLVLTLTSDNTFVDFRRISTVALKETRTFGITARLTRPSQAIVVYVTSARDLEGLEDMPDFWDMNDDEGGEHDNEANAINKAHCRHLCCREGLSKPPPMTKRRMESLVAGDGSPSKPIEANRASTEVEENPRRKPKPKPKEAPKPGVTSDRTLKRLEVLHQRLGVEKSLQLEKGGRIKLKEGPLSQPHPAHRPAPDFDVKFAELEYGSNVTSAGTAVMLSDSDEDLPEPGNVLNALRTTGSKTKTSSDSTDYANSEFDALIADFTPFLLLSVFRSPGRSGPSPVTTSAPALVEDDQGFELDASLFDIAPSTPMQTDTDKPEAEYLDSKGSSLPGIKELLHEERVKPLNDYSKSGKLIEAQETSADDPLAELEAWLQSGAVEIGGNE
ncbi:P-loop containing nucleoside triphosphate hydrolase protein [Trametes punicea]|nr:P-loop containing nucleoside triphosphate hydrolase protein [Trametes punicea]